MKLDKIIYTAEVNVTGGRDGRAISTDEHLSVKLDLPKALGGSGGSGTNPEQLFAAGYSACFLSALQSVAMQKKLKLPQGVSIHGIVNIGTSNGDFGLSAELQVTIPEMDREEAQALLDAAHQRCPYSKAIRANIEAKITLL